MIQGMRKNTTAATHSHLNGILPCRVDETSFSLLYCFWLCFLRAPSRLNHRRQIAAVQHVPVQQPAPADPRVALGGFGGILLGDYLALSMPEAGGAVGWGVVPALLMVLLGCLLL